MEEEAKEARRRSLPETTQVQVVATTRRRCALCFGLKGDLSPKVQGQIAHLNQNPEDDRPQNLAWLCLEHHNEYDARYKQSKKLLADEVKQYREELLAALKDWPLAGATSPPSITAAVSPTIIDLALYDRRIIIYRIVHDFILGVIGSASVDLSAIRKLASDTEEALFLFDDQMAAFIDTLYRRAIEMRGIQQRMNAAATRPLSDEEAAKLADKDTELVLWLRMNMEQPAKCSRAT